MATLVSLDRLIECRERDGKPFIAGTRVSVGWIAGLLHEGLTAEEMERDVFDGRLSAAKVHAAIAFYLLNKDMIDAQSTEEDRAYDRASARWPSWRDRR